MCTHTYLRNTKLVYVFMLVFIIRGSIFSSRECSRKLFFKAIFRRLFFKTLVIHAHTRTHTAASLQSEHEVEDEDEDEEEEVAKNSSMEKFLQSPHLALLCPPPALSLSPPERRTTSGEAKRRRRRRLQTCFFFLCIVVTVFALHLKKINYNTRIHRVVELALFWLRPHRHVCSVFNLFCKILEISIL